MASIIANGTPKNGPIYNLDRGGDVVLLVYDVPSLPETLANIPVGVLSGEAQLLERPANNACVYLIASQKHLVGSSEYFANLFQAGLKEAQEYWKKGYVELTIRHSLAGGLAFLLLMMIIHHRTRQVPRTITQQMLLEVAGLADYYKCHAAVDLWADTWIAAGQTRPLLTGEDIPARYRNWVCIAWAFHKREVFEWATRRAIETHEDLIPLEAPMPKPITDRMNQVRSDYLNNLVARLHSLRPQIMSGCLRYNDYLHGQHQLCTYLVIAGYTRRMLDLRLVPYPNDPFPRIQIESTLDSLKNLMDPVGPEEEDDEEAHKNCRLSARVAAVLVEFPAPCGLDLNDIDFPVSALDI
ncbi:hypothetical protein BDW75DRAFT_240344 [Aspergillus navahoensis]